MLGNIGSESALRCLMARWCDKEPMPEALGWCVTESLAHVNQADSEPIKKAAMRVARQDPAEPLPCEEDMVWQQTVASTNAVSKRWPKRSDLDQERRRTWAFYLLGYVGAGDESAALLFSALNESYEPSERVRGYAAQAIGRLQPREGRQKLQDALASESYIWVVRKIVRALGKVGTLDTIPVLEAYLRSGRVQVRTTVQLSIAEIRSNYAAR